MNSNMHHRRSFVWILLLALLALMLFARPAHSGWSADPVEIHATSALCPLVASVDDGNNGAIVVWQENTASGGDLACEARARERRHRSGVDHAHGGVESGRQPRCPRGG